MFTSHRILTWQRQGLDPVVEGEGLLKVQETHIVADGVAVVVGVADDLDQVPGLLLLLEVVELDAAGHHVHGEGQLAGAAVASCQHPVSVNHSPATEMGRSQTTANMQSHLS